MKRRSFLGGMGALALPWTVDPVQASGSQKPNLLFVLVDQWRFCAFSHGEVNDALVQTPNLDQFVTQGVRWRKSYSTTPVCSPERSTLITGRYAHQHRVMTNNLMIPPGNRCLAEIFREAGYATHYIGKTHFDGEGKYNNVDSEGNTGWLPGDKSRRWRRRGFTTYQGFNRGHSYIPSANDVEMIDDDGRYMTETIGRYEPEFQRELAENFISGNRNRPWLCYLSWGPPHTPYGEVPAKYKTYTVTEADRRPNVPAGNPGGGDLANYFAHCTALDDEFGKLMQFLENQGLKDNTLVVFTADHGDCIQSHSIAHKGKPQEESMHIPLFMRMPGTIPTGLISDTLIGGVDVMPTLLDLCGLPIPKSVTGVNKAKAARGQAMPEIDSIYCVYNTPWRALVTDQYKLVIQGTDPLSLASITLMYDLDNDPYELTNLKDNPAYATIKQQLYDRLLQWIADTDDPHPVKPVNALKMYTT